jgi:hypothetical protein
MAGVPGIAGAGFLGAKTGIPAGRRLGGNVFEFKFQERGPDENREEDGSDDQCGPE